MVYFWEKKDNLILEIRKLCSLCDGFIPARKQSEDFKSQRMGRVKHLAVKYRH